MQNCYDVKIGTHNIHIKFFKQSLPILIQACYTVIKRVRGKQIFNFSLVPRASYVKYLLVLLPKNLSDIYIALNFFLPAEHWVKICACHF